jgi:hypothetical protein
MWWRRARALCIKNLNKRHECKLLQLNNDRFKGLRPRFVSRGGYFTKQLLVMFSPFGAGGGHISVQEKKKNLHSTMILMDLIDMPSFPA